MEITNKQRTLTLACVENPAQDIANIFPSDMGFQGF